MGEASLRLPSNMPKSILLSWLVAVAIDFLLNAGVFASFFSSVQSFLLPPMQAFLRIPGGYASIFLLVLILTWLIYRGREATPVEGMRLGFLYGAATSLSIVLGLWSITSAPIGFLAIWSVDQVLEMTAAGAIIASTRSHLSRRATYLVLMGSIACFVVGIVLQNLLA
jgi:hypothetical protein